jgi:hypothetical protein
METKWLKEALFAGMTVDGFKLGTVLTLGWFWLRVAGCSMLYRGENMDAIDFTNILVVADTDSPEISLPSYIQHNNSSIYFYVIRRTNNCGVQERTMGAAVKVSIDTDGNLTLSPPNNIFKVKAKQMNGNKIHILWYYCSIEQKTEPVGFNVYYDEGTGQINYQDPIETIIYAGRVFYSYKSDALSTGRYLFAIRPESVYGTENDSLGQIKIQLNTTSPEQIDILSAKAF